ncbi:hypothetical protein [Clostridium sp. ZS2-4]|uniref:hypothetical protein n=1 Tax=Clostridium sp. ZS2-4 TaxID=2987703 RepID=UPI00227BAEE2|nr:hypothetical protein [Clostridium sp. ZS2-4]MCY6355128.1 hypothetical protein [Clostridium sp. ZS2-4]
MVKKKISMLLAAVLVASGVAVAAPAKAETKVAVTYAAPVQTMVETDNKVEFALQANTADAVEYKVWAQNIKTGKWVELTNGYQLAEVGSNPFIPATVKNLEEGAYKASIWVRKAGSEAKFDSYTVRKFKVQKDGYFAARANMDELGLKDTYKVGESVTLTGADQYKLHIFDPSAPVRSEGWMLDDTYEGAEATSYKFTKPGTYMVDVWGKKADSTNKYDGWVLKVVTVTEGQGEVIPTIEVAPGLDAMSRMVKVTLNVEDPENYKVTYTDGTELKYYSESKTFKAVVYSTNEEALKDAASYKIVCTKAEVVEATIEVAPGLDAMSRMVKITGVDGDKYDVEYKDGTKLKYYEESKTFKAVVYSTNEEELLNGDNYTFTAK